MELKKEEEPMSSACGLDAVNSLENQHDRAPDSEQQDAIHVTKPTEGAPAPPAQFMPPFMPPYFFPFSSLSARHNRVNKVRL